jgi:hypothetical protein
MTNREHGLNLFKIASEKHELLLKSEKMLFVEENSFIKENIINKRNRANSDWQFAQDKFTDFIYYLETNNLKLDEEK